MFDVFDQVGIDILLSHGFPQGCMSKPVKCFFEVNRRGTGSVDVGDTSHSLLLG